MNVVKVRLNSIDKIKEFAKVVVSFNSDIDIYKDDPNKAFDAKSLLALFAIDLGKKAYVRINTSNEDELVNFINAMKKFE